eukprot:677269-Alexandrium_andersonii.AAC.1
MSQSLREEISVGATGLGGGRDVRRQQRWSGAAFWEWEHGVETCCGHPASCMLCIGPECFGP